MTKDEHRAALIKSVSIQLAHAAGYELTEDNTSQWRLAIEMLVRGIEQLVEKSEPTEGEITMRHSDIKDG
jgi:hypothetical protein